MALDFLMSGGQFVFADSNLAAVPGIWQNQTNTGITSTAPAGAGDTYAFTNSGSSGSLQTPNLGANFSTLFAGWRLYISTISAKTLITFSDANVLDQCDLRINGSGQFYF